MNSKNYIEMLGLSESQSQSHENGSSKINIIVMNPEIHLHNNEKLQEEMKIKQNETALARKMNELENQIQDQNEILNWQAEILIEQGARLKDVYGQRDKRNERRSGNMFQPKYEREAKRRRRDRKNKQVKRNKFNNYNEIPQQNGHTRSKPDPMEPEPDQMDFWEWNGSEWIYTKSFQNRKQANSNPSAEQAVEISVAPSQTHDQIDNPTDDQLPNIQASSPVRTDEPIYIYDAHAETCPHCNNLSITFSETEILNHWCAKCRATRLGKS